MLAVEASQEDISFLSTATAADPPFSGEILDRRNHINLRGGENLAIFGKKVDSTGFR